MSYSSENPQKPSIIEIQQRIVAFYRDEIIKDPSLGKQISSEEWSKLSPAERDTILAAELFANQITSAERERSTDAQMLTRRVMQEVGVTLELEQQFAVEAMEHPHDC